MLSNFWKSYIASCEKTYSDLGHFLPKLCQIVMVLHIFYYLLNQILGGTEEIFLRFFVLAALAPSLAINLIPVKWLPLILVTGLIVSGPLFMSLVVSIELTKPIIDELSLMHRQYEYLATVALCLVASSKPKTPTIVSLMCFVIVVGFSLSSIALSAATFFLVISPFLSLWLFVVCLGIYLLQKKSLLLEKKSEALSTLSSSMAHELRTPLAGIKNFAAGLEKRSHAIFSQAAERENFELTPEEKYVTTTPAKIIIAAEQAITIIDMLLISSKDFEESKACFEEISIDQVIQDSIANFPYNNDHEAELTEYKQSGDILAVGPKTQLMHVMLNLLKNGLRFSQRNKNQRVVITLHPQDRMICVIDDGPGISAQAQRKIFDRFYTTEKYGQGTGIGLSFCKMTMESIGGTIEVESVLGEYTKFTLKFP